MEKNCLGLDLLVNNKKILKKNESKNNMIKNDEKDIDLDIKHELCNILKLKMEENINLEDKDLEIDEIIDNMIDSLIILMKYRYKLQK
jgi:hypothetical protein